MNFFKQIKHSIIYNIKLRLCCSLPSLKYLKQQNTSFIHPVGICISKEVVVGKNGTIAQNVTIGNSFSSKDKFNFPQIGNNVTIYANSVVYGGVTIGDNSIIAAGSVVNKDVPKCSIVSGNPAEIKPLKNTAQK